MEDGDAEGNPCKVFVGNLPFKMTQDRLASMFTPCGAVGTTPAPQDQVE